MKMPGYTLLLLALTAGLQGQEPPITPETPVSSVTLNQWLHSGDPRLIAWAADFARRRHETELISAMPELLASPTSSNLGNVEVQPELRLAKLAVLDALVQENFRVPIRTIEAIAPSFPVQAAILIAPYSLSESRHSLETWALGQTGESWTAKTLARIAAMMLAKDANVNATSADGVASNFVASIVAASENHLQISIRATDSVGGGTGGGACGDSGGAVRPGWPEVYFYYLEEYYKQDSSVEANTKVVVELDDDRILSRRLKENGGWGSCRSVEPLDARTRHRLIAHWLGVHDEDMSWHETDSATIVWTDRAAYERRLGEIVESQQRKLRDTVQQLQERGFLTEEESKRIAPKLVLSIQCDIKPCPLQ